jgi:hypothetical protein
MIMGDIRSAVMEKLHESRWWAVDYTVYFKRVRMESKYWDLCQERDKREGATHG